MWPETTTSVAIAGMNQGLSISRTWSLPLVMARISQYIQIRYLHPNEEGRPFEEIFGPYPGDHFCPCVLSLTFEQLTDPCIDF